MNARIGFRLSVMMALVYAVQGAFWPLLAVHLEDLGVGGRARGWVFATMAMGSLLMPLGASQLVDRFFAGQRVLAVIFGVSAVFLGALATGAVTGSLSLFVLFLAFWMVTAPAFSLASAIAMRHLPDPPRQFAGVRLWGTVGWMAVGWLVTGVMAWSGSSRLGQGTYEAFWVSAGLAVAVAAYGLTLPDTPPLAMAARPGLAGVGVSGLLGLTRSPGMRRFLLTALGVHVTTPFVYQVLPTYLVARGLPRAWVSSSMTLCQGPEVVALAMLPWLIGRVGIKTTLLLGLGAWTLRFGCLAFDPPLWVTLAGIPLQGVGYACFTVAGQVFTDEQAPGDRRAGAQALYFVVTSGLGSLLGSVLAGDVSNVFPGDYSLIFLVPCVIDSTLLVYFCAGFQPHASTAVRTGAFNLVDSFRKDSVRGTIVRVGNLVTEPADG